MKLEKLNPKVLKEWHAVATAQDQWAQLFKLFANDKDLRRIFKRDTERPKKLGVWSQGSAPWLYAGIGVIQSNVGVLWVTLMVPGKKAKSSAKLQKSLSRPFKAAKSLLNSKGDESANFGNNAEDGNTYFNFAQPITPEFDGQSEKILAWSKTTVITARGFGMRLCKWPVGLTA